MIVPYFVTIAADDPVFAIARRSHHPARKPTRVLNTQARD